MKSLPLFIVGSGASLLWLFLQHQVAALSVDTKGGLVFPIRPTTVPSSTLFASISTTSKEQDSQPRDEAPLPPGRGRWPLLGDTLRLLSPLTMGSYQVDSMEKYGKIWKTSVLFKRAVFVSGGDNLETLTREERRTRTCSPFFPPHHHKLFGPNSLLVNGGPNHDRLRKLIQPAVATPELYISFIQTEIDNWVQVCASKDKSFSASEAIREFTLSVSLRVLFGSDVSEDISERLLTDITIWSKGLLSAPTTALPWTAAGKAMKARKRIHTLLTSMIEAERSTGPVEGKGASLLNRLVHSQDDSLGNNSLSNDDIIDNALTLIFAGSDTTASVLTAGFYVLATNRDLEARLRSSCDRSEDESTRLVEAFVSETQRAYPPAPFQARIVGDEQLEVGGFRIPRGWLAIYAFAGTLLGDDETYSSPESFRIDRWLAESPPPVWAFGGGRRMCPGKRLSFLESIMFFKSILGRKGFEWDLEPDQDLSFRYTPGLFPVDGLQIKVKR